MALRKGSSMILKKRTEGVVTCVRYYGKAGSKFKDLPEEGLPVIGSLLSFISAGSSPKLHLYIDAKHKKLGPVFRERMPSTSTVFLSDPEKIRQVFTLEGKYPTHFLPESWILYNQMYNRKRGLLFMEGEEWLHYRKTINKFLIKDDILTQLSLTYKTIIDSLINKWKLFDGQIVNNLQSDMYLHSISFMAATAMGSSYKDHFKDFEKDLISLAESYQKIFDITSKLMVIPVGLVSYLNLAVWKEFVKAMNESLDGSERVIKKMFRKASNDGLLNKLLNTGVTDQMICSLLTDLMIAAGDTTAYTMQWALYLLANNKSIQQTIIKDNDLVKGVIKETLRLYPAAPFLTRVIQQPLEMNGYTIPAGQLVVMSMYTCARDESNFPDATEFRPQRWNRQNNNSLGGVNKKFALLPFSLGARSCVGKKLAQHLMNSTITRILCEYEVTRMRDVEMLLRMTPAPSTTIQIRINHRKNK